MTHDRIPTVPTALSGHVSFPGDSAYDAGTRIFSVSSAAKPRLVAHCASTEHVKAAVAYARDGGLELSVKAGGHDWAGRALCGGLVIDLSPMRNIELAADRCSAWIGGGCLIEEVLAALDPLGLAAVTSSCGAVGMTGLTLGGGYGPLIGRFGLSLDNLLGAKVVLADGRCVVADARHEPDLFWALRGGGGNFGVVISLHVALHELPSVYGGMITYPFTEARTVLCTAAELLEAAPDALTAQIGLVPGPAGVPVVMVAPLWCGAADEGVSRLAPFARLGKPINTALSASAFGVSTKIWDAYDMTGVCAVMGNRWLPSLSADSIDVWLDAFAQTPGSACAVFTHEFRGAATRVAPDATAFGMRDPHVLVEILSIGAGREDVEASTQWVETLSDNLGPLALPGGYANLLVSRQAEQVQMSFGCNAGRLREIKARYDPSNLFRSALPLPH